MKAQFITEKSAPLHYNEIIPYHTIGTQGNPVQTAIYINSGGGQKCPECYQTNTMVYNDEFSMRQHLWAILLCLTCCLCAWIPYVSKDCMFRRGRCSRCGYATKDNTNNIGLKVVIGVLVGLPLIIFIIFTIVMVYLQSLTTNEVSMDLNSDWKSNLGLNNVLTN